MTDYLFIDNFRGFSDISIPIKDVNFLVGENSTGKTSVLGLLKLFGTTQFLSPTMTIQPQSEFADKHVTFGYFTDMVSAHSDDRSCFHVGFVAAQPRQGKTTPSTAAWLCTFVEDKGLPRLSNLTFYQSPGKVTIQFNRNSIRYAGERFNKPLEPDDICTKFVEAWKQEHMTPRLEYHALEDNVVYGGRMPIFLVLSLVRGAHEALNQKDGAQKTTRFYPPDLWSSGELVWLAPIRTEPSRIYDSLTREFSPEGSHTPYLIRTTLRSKNAPAFRDFMRRVGINSGLFEDVSVKPFGRDPTSPFEVDIVLDKKAFNLSSVGYGVSQALPVLVELVDRPRGSLFAIQQPEVHLHPRAQAALGDVFFQMAASERKKLLIETHSDFTIDRFRVNYRKAKGEKPDSQIIFFERRNKHNIATSLPIGDKGELPEEQPSSYREFFIREELKLLGDDTL